MLLLLAAPPWGMRDWEDRCKDHKTELVAESVICQEDPDDEAQEKCRMPGKALV